MVSWSEGYVSEIGYTAGYYSELNPQRIKLALLYNGYAFPKVSTACELGYGQGLSINIHAAASGITWFGTDFNPSQAAFSQEMARASQATIQVFDQSFKQFCERTDLPNFDFIGLHGIWSWVSDENRKIIVDFLREKLNVGGVVYISYNTLPGLSTMMPLRHMMAEHASTMGSKGASIADRINNAFHFVESVLGQNPSFLSLHPYLSEKLKHIRAHQNEYLAHEYFNRDWKPFYFSEVLNQLSDAKLQYACSAHYADSLDAINLTPNQKEYLTQLNDVGLRETVRDFFTNQQFRREYWVKGLRNLAPLQQIEYLRAHRVVLSTPLSAISLKVKGALGEASMNEEVYKPILEILSDFKPKSLGDVELRVKDRGINFNQVVEAVLILCGAGYVISVQDDADINQSIKSSSNLNRYFSERARSTTDASFMCCPASGGGIMLSRVQHLFLDAIYNGIKSQSDWPKRVWNILQSQGHAIAKDGKPVTDEALAIQELVIQAQRFAEVELPLLKSLKVY